MATDSSGDVVLFGGFDDVDGWLDDTWIWTGTTWVKQNTTVEPANRANHRMAVDETGRVVLFGGGTVTSVRGDTWVWA